MYTKHLYKCILYLNKSEYYKDIQTEATPVNNKIEYQMKPLRQTSTHTVSFPPISR